MGRSASNFKHEILGLILRLARYSGLFALSRAVTAGDLRILCYHGCALCDEHLFRPGVFMTKATFERHMYFLVRAGYPVLSLDEAIGKLEAGRLPKGATVITIDDGWYGTYREQYPVLRKLQMPATIYVASYYVQHQTQVFNVCLDYLLWKAGIDKINCLGARLAAEGVQGFEEPMDTTAVRKRLNKIADAMDGAPARQALLCKVSHALGVDWKAIEADRLLSFMSAEEIHEMALNGIDIQLHTHRHRFPDDSTDIERREVEDNRRALQGIVQSKLCHFCYPSGIYNEKNVHYLHKLGIETATTTKPGFNRRSTSLLELRRFLDSESISDLEFEAEMSGFFELIRRCGYRI